MQAKNKILIPVDLAKFVLKEKISNLFAFYLLIQKYSNGKLKKDSSLINRLSQELEVDKRTIRNYFKKAIQRDFIGFDEKSKICFVRSINHIFKKYNLNNLQCAVFNYSDITLLKYFLFACVIANLNRNQGVRLVSNEHSKGRSKQKEIYPYYSVSVETLCDILSLSPGTISNYKLAAFRYQFINLCKIFFQYKGSIVDAEFLNKYCKKAKTYFHINNKTIWGQASDFIESCVEIKKGKNLNHK